MKVQEAEKMNEINDLYEDLKRQKKENEMRAMASDLSAGLGGEHGEPRGARRGAFGGQYFPARGNASRFEPTPEARIAWRSRPEGTCWPPRG